MGVGDNIKVILKLHTPVNGVDAERLWFKIVEINGDKILAELDNDPLFIKSISGTDMLQFSKDNIFEVLRDE